MVSTSGPGMALLFILIVPWLFSVPMALASAEMATAMPVEGGFYRWTRAAFGDFWGFQCGWWNWTGTFFHVGLVWSGAGGLRRAGHSGAQSVRALGDRGYISDARRGIEHSWDPPGGQVDTRLVSASDAAGSSVRISRFHPRPLQSFPSLDATWSPVA